MQNLKAILFFLLLFSTQLLHAQQKDPVVLEYIQHYKDIAVSEMLRTGVPAAIKLAQGIHETDAGKSILVKKSNNHFGIKCKSDWTGSTVKHTDDAPNECFRRYESPFDSYRDHSDFLKKSSRYASLFELDPTDYEGWAKGLKKAGYATNPRYPQVIIKLIEEYGLQDYTMIALGRKDPGEMLAESKNNGLDNKEVEFMERAEEKVKAVVSPVVYKEETKPVYPTGEFRINDTRVIWVKKGTSFLSIAEKYNIPLARLYEFNELKNGDIVNKDQLIYLQRKRKTGNSDFHIVKEGESLFDIAQYQAIRLESLLEYNHLRPGMNPKEGSMLYLRATAPSKPALASGR